MNETIVCRPLRDDEAEAASALARQVFDQFVAPTYAQEGRDVFHAYAAADALRQRHGADHVTFVAEGTDGQLIAMLHLRETRHIAMLFVHAEHQRQGVARRLFAVARQRPWIAAHAARVFTVNSSPNAIAAYQRMGFVALGPEQTFQGIRFIPMEYQEHPLDLGNGG